MHGMQLKVFALFLFFVSANCIIAEDASFDVTSVISLLLDHARNYLSFFLNVLTDDVRSESKGNFANFSSSSRLGVYQQAAVTTDARECAAIGRKALVDGGSAIDGAIAALLCMGLVIPQSLGLGGGCFINYYDAASKKATIVNARGWAPSYATEDMFKGNQTIAKYGTLSIAVPGELKGYWEAHKRFGKLPWKQLFEDTIRLAESGFQVGNHFANAIAQKAKLIEGSSTQKMFTNPTTGKFYLEGQVMKRPDFAATLRILSNSTDREFYEGKIAQQILRDLKAQGSRLTEEDFANYEVRVEEPITMTLPGKLTFYSARPPASGALLGFILNVMLRDKKDSYVNSDGTSTVQQASLFYHRLIETWKFSYAKRNFLGDEQFDDVAGVVANVTSEDFAEFVRSHIDNSRTFEPESYEKEAVYTNGDSGTAHVSVIDKFGNGASIGSSVNGYFGSFVASPSTGIVFNNQMDDFSVPGVTNQYNLPPSKANRIEPGKRPLSSMCPLIIVDVDGKVRFSAGGSGGTQITSAISLVAIQSLLLDQNLKESIDAPRVHHQLYPNVISYEQGFSREILNELEARGHKTEVIKGRGAVVVGLEITRNGKIHANSDYRKGGNVGGF